MTGLREALVSSRALRPFARLGALSPATTLATFSPGAQLLLKDAERTGELALHRARAVYFALIAFGIGMWLRPPALSMALAVAVMALVWLLAVRGLRSGRAFGFTRYFLVVLDVWLIVDGVILARAEPVRALGRAMGLDLSLLTPAFFAAFLPPLLVLIAFSSALRLDTRAAVLTALLSFASYLLYATAFAVPPEIAVFSGAIIAFGGILGVNTARVVRYLLLKTQQAGVYESYSPESLSRDLETHGALERTGRVEDVTLLVCDLRGFTQLSERLSPSETVTMVNTYLDAVCPPIAGAGGVIDKFMGDGVLAFFEGGGNAARAVTAARRVLEAAERLRFAGASVRVGIALHSGQVLVGTVGPRTRREYTIISDAVNTVTRLEELNKVYGSVIVASSTTLANVDERDRAGFDGPVEVALRGRGAGVSVYVFGAKAPLGDQQDLSDRLRRFVGGDPD